MADKKPSAMNWKERIDAGVPLNPLQDVQATADFNFMQRKKEQEDRAAFESRKRGYSVEGDGSDVAATEGEDTSTDTGKKGNK